MIAALEEIDAIEGAWGGRLDVEAVRLGASSHLKPWSHLSAFVDVYQRAFKAACGLGPPVFALLSAPPQFGKTSLVQHATAAWLRQRPMDFLGFVTYGQDLANTKSRGIRDIAKRMGVAIRHDSKAVDLWNTTLDGGLLARGIDGSITGQAGLRLLTISDPIRGRLEAMSQAIRNNVWGQLESSVFTRRHPQTSIILEHTRWHEDDPIGRAKKIDLGNDQKFEVVNLPAILPNGESLWPAEKPLWFLEQQRALSAAWWSSLFMGEPRAREGKLFQGVSFYEQLPSHGLVVAIGVDLAYSSKTSADFSVAIAVAAHPATHSFYVLDVLRKQVSAPAFAEELRTWRSRWPGARMHAYLGGTELGAADFFREKGVPIETQPATADKQTRALSASDAWNAGRLMLPMQKTGLVERRLEWLDPFVDEFLEFSGINDPHDDQVDALAAVIDALPKHEHMPLVQPLRVGAPHEGTVTTLRLPGWRPGQGRLPTRHGG